MAVTNHWEGSAIIRLIITDLDNTLYDWVTFFAKSFYDMVTVAARILKVPEEKLLDELRAVHQRYQNSEHPFALLETESVSARFESRSRDERRALLDDAFHQFNRTRRETLRPYPGVTEALEEIKRRGIPIVGHTEATVPNALFRLKMLNMNGAVNRLYAVSPRDRETTGARPAELDCAVRYLCPDERKPDRRVVLEICSDMRVNPSETLYVGDSISNDIGMAKEAGAWTAWAEYGTRYDPADWNRLVRITHWSKEDVNRAQAAKERYASVRPDIILHEGFFELIPFLDSFATPTAGKVAHG